jgi:hypothetical protein
METIEMLPPIEDFRACKPGVYEGIPQDDYFALKGPVSASVLKRLHTHSPLHALDYMQRGIVPTDEMDIGSGGHCLLFTPSEFDNQFVLASKCSATVKSSGLPCSSNGSILSGGQWFCGTHGKGKTNDADKTVLTPDEWERVTGICRAVKADPLAASILESATDFELTILWQDEETGLLCKSRLDILCRDKGVLPDLKTCRSIRSFNDDAFRMAYHIQMAMYQEAAHHAGIPVDCIAVIAAENDRPHDVQTPEIDPDLLKLGHQHWREAMRTFAECMRTGNWPGHQLNQLTIPKWNRNN